MRWCILAGLSLWLVACVPPRQGAGGESSLPPLVMDELDDHEVKEELRWALYRRSLEPRRLLQEARAAYANGAWEVAYEASYELVDEHPRAPEVRQATWIFGRASAEVAELDRAERAMLAALCTEAAPAPLLAGAMPPFPSRAATCTPGPGAPPDLARGWAQLAEVERSFGRPHEAEEALARSVVLSPAGSVARSEIRARMMTDAVYAGDDEGAFRAAAALVDEGGEPLYVEAALGALANGIADDDWNGDGRKDVTSGVSRAPVARWLASDPPAAPDVLREAIGILLRRHRCTEARRIHARLSRLANGREAARAVAGEVRGCLGG